MSCRLTVNCRNGPQSTSDPLSAVRHRLVRLRHRVACFHHRVPTGDDEVIDDAGEQCSRACVRLSCINELHPSGGMTNGNLGLSPTAARSNGPPDYR